MKMRKLFAGLAAAATLLGGLALGAGTAVAEDVSASGGVLVQDNATFKFTADDADQWKNREVKYYKLADYVRYGTAPDAKYGVQTATTANKDAIKDALKAAGATSLPNDENTDLLAWALQNGALDKESDKPWTGSTRLFADSLAEKNAVKNNAQAVDFGQQAGTDRTVQLPAGIYLFLDTTVSNGNPAAGEGENANNGNISNGTEAEDDGGKVVTQSAPIVLASGTVVNREITDPLKDTLDPAHNAAGDNIVSFKNHVTPVTKTIGDGDKTVSVGQKVTYTVKSELPLFTTGFTDYKFALTDTPGSGQTVDLNSIKVTIDGTVIEQGNADNQYVLEFNGLTDEDKTAQKFDGDGQKAFIINLSNYVQKLTYNAARQGKIVLTYDVVINDGALINPEVPNTVEVNDNNSKAEDRTKVTLGKFSFVKKAADGSVVKTGDAKFRITAADDNDKDRVVPVTPAAPHNEASSDAEGVVRFNGLADGVYEVEETQTPSGFINSAKAKFKVRIQGGKAVAFKGTDAWGLAKESADNTESGAEITDYSVINVRNITELPKTGAAGIAMFTVAGLLLAGAAALVFAKSRATKRALHA